MLKHCPNIQGYHYCDCKDDCQIRKELQKQTNHIAEVNKMVDYHIVDTNKMIKKIKYDLERD